MDEPFDDVVVAASSADEADSCEQAVGSLQDSSDGSCTAAKASKNAEVLAAVRKQVEFYFSDANLPTDKHLLKQIQRDPDGYVPLRMIAGFKRVKALTKDLAVVAEALNGSTLLNLDETNSRIKRSAPLPAFDVNDIARRTVVVEHLPDKSTIESVTQLLSQYGEVVMVRICSRGNTNKLPGWLGKAVDSINMTMAPGEFALVEFGSEDACVACVNKTRNPDNWRTSLRVRHLLPTFKPAHKAGSNGVGHEHGESKQQSRGHSTGGAADRHQHHGQGVSYGSHGQSKDTQGDHQQQDGAQNSSDAAEAAAAISAATAAAGVLPNLAPIRTISAAAVQRAASPHANVVGSPVGLSPIKVSSGASNAAAGVGGSIGSPRTASSPAPPEVSSFIDSILSAPTGNTPKGGSSSRWSGAGDWGGSSSGITPAAAVAAALAGVSTPPQSSSPRHTATGGARGSASGGAFASGTGTPTRLSTATSNVAQLAPTQSALASQLAAAAAAAAQAAMAGSPKAAQGSGAASWRSSSKQAAVGASISAPNTPLAGLSAGDAVVAALDEEFGDVIGPSRAQAVASPELSSSPKPGPWIPASRMHHMQQAAHDGHNMMRSSGSEAEDNAGSWKRRSWTGQAGSPHGGGMRPPKPRTSGTGAAGTSSRPRRPSWHAADADEVAGTLEMSSGAVSTSNDGAIVEPSGTRNRRSRLQQASGDFRSAVESNKEATAEAGASVAQAMASLSLGGSHHHQQRRRSSTTGGAAEAIEEGEDEHEHEEDDHLGEGASSSKSRRRRRKRSSTGSRRASLDETGAGRRTSIDEGAGKSGSKRQSEEGSGVGGSRNRRHSLDEGSGSKPNSRPHSRAGALSPEDPTAHRPSSGGGRQHSGGSQPAEHHGAAKEGKKKDKKDYASWAAATPEFRAAAAKHSSGGGAASSANMQGTSPSRAGQAGISPLRASMGGAPGGHHDADSHVRIARMPDGTRGFGMGRGRPVTPAAP